MPAITSSVKCFGKLTLAVALAAAIGGSIVQRTNAESLDLPDPRSSTNGAIHYQRACLFLSAVDIDQRAILRKPIWQIITAETTDDELAKIDDLLIASRHAIRSGLVGADQMEADFGLDIRQYMIASYVPHVELMKDIGRLIALHGMQKQSAGDWKLAAETYAAGLRMGRHMTHQTTLAEALAGVEILESMYFSIGHWAVRCPDVELVDQVSDMANAMAADMVNPARTLRFEASISNMRLDAFEEAYPNGPWAEMLLEAMGGKVPATDREGRQKAAVAAAVKAGVPKDAFADEASVEKFIRSVRSSYADLARESAECLVLHPPHSIEQGEAVFAKYAAKLPATERLSALNPARAAAFFAVHQAELDILRQVLAISAERTSEGFPASLDAVKDRLGDRPLKSPYDGSPYVYEQLDGGKGFSLSLQKAKVGDIELPPIRFHYVMPTKAE